MTGRSLIALAVVGAAAPAGAVTCPNILFVVDQSSSMADDPNGMTNPPAGMSKFDLARSAVIQVVNTYGDRVSMGLELFRSNAFHNDAQCFSDTMITVEPAHDTATQIIMALKAATPDPDYHTNTGEAIKRAAQDMVLHDMARKNFLVLITDGVPSCNSTDLMTLSTTGSSDYSIGEINNAANQNPPLHTFVIGFDGMGSATDLDKQNLDYMANAGREPVKGCGGNVPCYYSASDPQKFQDAISKVIDQIVGGEFGNVMCDDSCYSNGCPAGQVCERGELDPVAKCVPDACMGASCGGGQFCRDGKCVNACLSGCKTSQKCVDGQCVADPCWGVTCDSGTACNPATGLCVPDLCMGRQCAMYNTCDPVTGKCVDDLCHIITCPMGTMCSGGNCAAPPQSGKHNGCSVSTKRDDGQLVFALTMLGLLGVALAMRRRS